MWETEPQTNATSKLETSTSKKYAFQTNREREICK